MDRNAFESTTRPSGRERVRGGRLRHGRGVAVDDRPPPHRPRGPGGVRRVRRRTHGGGRRPARPVGRGGARRGLRAVRPRPRVGVAGPRVGGLLAPGPGDGRRPKRTCREGFDGLDDVDARLGLVSNNQHHTVGYALDRFRLGDAFETAYGHHHTVEGLRRRKPDPHYLDRALSDLGTRTRSTWAIAASTARRRPRRRRLRVRPPRPPRGLLAPHRTGPRGGRPRGAGRPARRPNVAVAGRRIRLDGGPGARDRGGVAGRPQPDALGDPGVRRDGSPDGRRTRARRDRALPPRRLADEERLAEALDV